MIARDQAGVVEEAHKIKGPQVPSVCAGCSSWLS